MEIYYKCDKCGKTPSENTVKKSKKDGWKSGRARNCGCGGTFRIAYK